MGSIQAISRKALFIILMVTCASASRNQRRDLTWPDQVAQKLAEARKIQTDIDNLRNDAAGKYYNCPTGSGLVGQEPADGPKRPTDISQHDMDHIILKKDRDYTKERQRLERKLKTLEWYKQEWDKMTPEQRQAASNNF